MALRPLASLPGGLARLLLRARAAELPPTSGALHFHRGDAWRRPVRRCPRGPRESGCAKVTVRHIGALSSSSSSAPAPSSAAAGAALPRRASAASASEIVADEEDDRAPDWIFEEEPVWLAALRRLLLSDPDVLLLDVAGSRAPSPWARRGDGSLLRCVAVPFGELRAWARARQASSDTGAVCVVGPTASSAAEAADLLRRLGLERVTNVQTHNFLGRVLGQDAPAAAAATGSRSVAGAAAAPGRTAPRGEAEGERDAEMVEGLEAWLGELALSKYEGAAAAWCEEMGAAHLDEVKEHWEHFAESLGLKPLERIRLERGVGGSSKASK
eukprot:TRINITY_DN313_c0_g2_i1.p1 TRINITY_DN313_c0_g2~~TRINITY_DN313_c0_g2_i1.p1  ORF type:complete len:328 (+),score=74.59 TRINITY_DN313_c0_g2_i1:71-1054(+)